MFSHKSFFTASRLFNQPLRGLRVLLLSLFGTVAGFAVRLPPRYAPNLAAARAFAFAACSSRFLGAELVSSEQRSRIEISAISSTAARKGPFVVSPNTIDSVTEKHYPWLGFPVRNLGASSPRRRRKWSPLRNPIQYVVWKRQNAIPLISHRIKHGFIWNPISIII